MVLFLRFVVVVVVIVFVIVVCVLGGFVYVIDVAIVVVVIVVFEDEKERKKGWGGGAGRNQPQNNGIRMTKWIVIILFGLLFLSFLWFRCRFLFGNVESCFENFLVQGTNCSIFVLCCCFNRESDEVICSKCLFVKFCCSCACLFCLKICCCLLEMFV